jgi:hypothetical protein
LFKGPVEMVQEGGVRGVGRWGRVGGGDKT